jgi:hypothetical protein
MSSTPRTNGVKMNGNHADEEDVERVALVLNAFLYEKTYGAVRGREGVPTAQEFWEKMKDNHRMIAAVTLRAIQRGDNQ